MVKKTAGPYKQVKELIDEERFHIALSKDKRIGTLRQLTPIELINCIECLLYKYEELFRVQNKFEEYRFKVKNLTGEYDIFDAVDIEDAQEVWKDFLEKLNELHKSIEENIGDSDAGFGSALQGLYKDEKIKGKKGTPQGPINDIFYKHNLMVVYGTIASNAKCKEKLKENAYSFAETISRKIRMKIDVKKDINITSEDIKNYHIILFGGPGYNDLAEEIYEELPIPLETNKIKVGDMEFTSEDTKIILLTTNPLNPKKYLLIYSATGYKGMIDLWGLYHGPTDFVIGNNFNWLARGFFDKSDETFWQYDSDLLEINNPLIDMLNNHGWNSTSSEHYTFYYPRASLASKDINKIIKMHENNYGKLLKKSGLKKGDKVSVYIYETNDNKENISGIRSDASFDPYSPKIHVVYNQPIIEYGPEKILESLYRHIIWNKNI